MNTATTSQTEMADISTTTTTARRQSQPPPPSYSSSTQTPTSLQIDFSWRKLQALIFDSTSHSTPVYTVRFNAIRAPHLTVESAVEPKTVIGTGSLHAVSINADYSVHGRKGVLKALKRWKTAYTHLSYAYSEDGKTPVPMTWEGECGLTKWDFTCLDERQNPVARFTQHIWNCKNVGRLEFLGPKAGEQEARDEIVVTALTLVYCMNLRSASLPSFVGALFARPGPIKGSGKKEGMESELITSSG